MRTEYNAENTWVRMGLASGRMGANHSANANATSSVLSQSLIQVEQHCSAVASNIMTITITQPPNCNGRDGGWDIVDPNINQDAQGMVTCDNTSYFSALLAATIANNLSASVATEMAGVTWLGATLPSELWQNDSVTTNAVNSVVQTTDYSSLQTCRTQARNVLSITINDCNENREVGGGSTFSQKAVADMSHCVNSSTALANLQANIQNTLSSTDSVTDPFTLMIATIGNIIMTCAVIAGVGGIVVAILSTIAVIAIAKSKVKSDQEKTKQMSILESQQDKVRIAKKEASAAAPAPSAPPRAAA